MYLEEEIGLVEDDIDLLLSEPPRFYERQQCYAYDRHGNQMLDYNGLPRIMTVRATEVGYVHLYQCSVPFDNDGNAYAKVTSWWWKCSIKPVEEVANAKDDDTI